MKPVYGTIVDTSSLLSLAKLTQRSERLSAFRANRDVRSAYGGIDQAIEALVLYDNVVVDGPSFLRNKDLHPTLATLEDVCGRCDLSPQEEIDIYRTVVSTHVSRLNPDRTEWRNLYSIAIERWMADEVGVPPSIASSIESVDWRTLQGWADKQTTPQVSALVEAVDAVRNALGANKPVFPCAGLQLVRFFYYLELQTRHSMNLVLHPIRAQLLGHNAGSPTRILELFDTATRTAYLERQERWLGTTIDHFTVPMLTDYVISTATRCSDVLDVVMELRHSARAQSFRSGVNFLLDRVRSGDTNAANNILSELDRTCDEWASGHVVDPGKKTRTIHLSVPMFGVGADLDIPVPTLTKTPSEKILVFVHELVRRRPGGFPAPS